MFFIKLLSLNSIFISFTLTLSENSLSFNTLYSSLTFSAFFDIYLSHSILICFFLYNPLRFFVSASTSFISYTLIELPLLSTIFLNGENNVLFSMSINLVFKKSSSERFVDIINNLSCPFLSIISSCSFSFSLRYSNNNLLFDLSCCPFSSL
ncbi:hypothetical protein BvCmsSIP065_00837 [Escherichia coli]|nr:hypothetical protein BvCmsNSP078_02993 [Escherichia coli]GDV24924.1 hypothetical protein BvCmsSIP065_00837 [Escherichia coli]GDW33023.1 hypothetical protein BvCmsSIP015_02112 [Escherichia coli]